MIRTGVVLFACVWVIGLNGVAQAQEPPARIGPYVVDVRGTIPAFRSDPELAQSRSLSQAELPGSGFGGSLGVHVYLPRVGPISIGVGGEATVARSHSTPIPTTDNTLRPVTETFKSVAPQISLNFRGGNGWSYLSVGVGRARWSVVPDGADPQQPDTELLGVLDYGGGARWFIKKHLAFSLDVRLHEIKQGAPQVDRPGSPHTILLVIGAGVSVR